MSAFVVLYSMRANGGMKAPSIESLKRAMQMYARQGDTSTITINDDGLRIPSVEECDARIIFYANYGIRWVTRPLKPDSSLPDGFKRAGRFKKGANTNYGLALSFNAKKHLSDLRGEGQRVSAESESGSQLDVYDDLEEKVLQMAIDEVYEGSGRRFRPWALYACACRLGEIVLLVDSDTIVRKDCLRDAAWEIAECPTVPGDHPARVGRDAYGEQLRTCQA